MTETRSYRATCFACVVGIANQAVIANITALLFVPFMELYGLELWQLGVLIGVNFCAQLFADALLSTLIDRVSYRVLAMAAVLLSAVGLTAFALLPLIPTVAASGKTVYICMIVATLFFAFSGGMLEVVITPIVDAIPNSSPRTMSLLHSFYAWGQVLVVVVTSLFILFVGTQYWHYIVLCWVVLPLLSAVLFAFCPLNWREITGESGGKKRMLFSPYMMIAMLAIFTAGGTEITMNQYISTFATLGLGYDKIVADLLGMCLFAVMMGIGRTAYGILGDRLNMNRVLMAGSLVSFVCYLVVGLVPKPQIALAACVVCGLSASLLWPGTLVVAGKRFLGSGAWIFAALAISGDLGGSLLPSAAGFLADKAGLNMAFLISSVVPLVCFVCNVLLFRYDKKAGLIDPPRR